MLYFCVVTVVCWAFAPVNGAEWEEFGNSMYKLHTERVNYTIAQDNCACQDAYVVEINSNCENVHIRNLARQGGVDVFLGGRNTAGVWRWQSNGAEFPVNNGRWGTGEPNNSGECVQLWWYIDYMWDDTTCDDTNGYICEKARP